MSVNNIHGIFAVEVHTDDMTPAVLIGGITEQNVNLDSQVRSESSSGSVYPSIQSLVAQRPAASFTTRNLAVALGVLGTLGKPITATTNPGLNLYGQKHQEGGTRATGSSHIKYNVTEGIILPRSISAEHQGDATLGCEVLVTYDGANDPVAKTESEPLPSGVTDPERFTLGPVTIAGVTVPQVRSLSIDFGLNAVSEGADSDIWDTFSNIRTVTPSITIGGIDVDLLKAAGIPLTGKAATHLNTTVYLRKREDGGAFVADGTPEHIKITAAGMAVVDGAFSASGNDAGQLGLRVPLKFDGTNTPMVLDLASAIT